MSLRENVSRAARETSDPVDRDVRDYPHDHPSSDFTTVGDIFADATNKDRKKPFDIRTVMRSVVDQDHPVLERWADMADADTSVVFDAHVAGIPVCVIGIESRVIPRNGWVPRRRAGPVDVGNSVPAVLEEDRPRDQRRKRKPTPGGAGESFGFRRFTGVTPADSSSSSAPKSAEPSSTSTDRSCSPWSRAITAELSWSSPAR